MFERFGLNIVDYVTDELIIYSSHDFLCFGYVNSDMIMVVLMFGLMKLKLNTAKTELTQTSRG